MSIPTSMGMASLSDLGIGAALFSPCELHHHHHHHHHHQSFNFFKPPRQLQWRISASSAAPGVDLNALESAIAKKDSDAVKDALDQLSELGWAKKWGSQPYVSRRTTSLRELTTLGMKNAENLAIPSVRNDAAFLFTVVGTTGFLGVLAGQLPGDWGFFVPYLVGSISLIVLGVGSTSPGLLQAAISGFSSVFPDYQERIARHEAAHFLGTLYCLMHYVLPSWMSSWRRQNRGCPNKLEPACFTGINALQMKFSCIFSAFQWRISLAFRFWGTRWT
ncbi:hypothetical protein EUGRSUZ_I00323 [Eucalyptus grandis]|uniref:Uncharacterized protein n=2 Tax=Eucalyptus grandis TaxID=71139 RepID=A0A059AK42_EUCGR|nr:hypothetical protein EUGRSUZ_I00323 [Eucalyptus grandis]